jgi:hypothetical protein
MNRHRGCIICGQFHRYRAAQRAENARKMRRVYSACLTALGPWSREALPRKQETPGLPGPKVSTDPTPVLADGMAAHAQHDRGR